MTATTTRRTAAALSGSIALLAAGLIWCALAASPAAATTCQEFGSNRCRIDIELHKSHVQTTDRDITRVAVADPDIADIQLITPRQVLVLAGNKPGGTNLILWHGDDEAVVYEIKVFIPDDLIQALRRHIALLAPRASVAVVPTGKNIILNGTVNSQRELNRVLAAAKSFDVSVTNMLTVSGSQQVQLEVKIAEVSKSGSKQMGLGFINQSDWNIGLFPSGSFSATSTVGENYTGLSSELSLESPFASAFQLALHSQSGDTVGILGILKGQGLARILATPTLVTMSGQEADFLVGGEFPIPVAGQNGAISITYKEFGILLRFTPVVVDKETITIQVAPEVSSVDYSLGVVSGGVSVPGISTRRGAATLQLKDGQSFVMAGLLKEETATTISKFPFLGDLPIIGSLFTSKSFQKNESELMIMVTPRLVRALNADELPPLPGAGERDNISDVDFFLRNLPPVRQKADAENPPEPETAQPKAPAAPQPGAETPVPAFRGATGFAE